MAKRMHQDEGLIDRIYEAAALPDLWPGVLDSLSTLAGAAGAVLLTADAHNLRWTATEALRRLTESWVAGGWHLRNTRMPPLLAKQHAGFVREIDLFSEEDLAENKEIQEFWRRYGLGYGIGTAIPVPTGELLVFSFEREFKRGPAEKDVVDRLDLLRPHLARAALLSGRLLLERARAISAALDAVGLPAAVLRDGGRLLSANSKLQQLIPDVFRDQSDRLYICDQRADLLLNAALKHLSLAANISLVRSIPIAASDEQPPFVIHVIPVRGVARDVFDRGLAILLATPVVPKDVPTAEVLQVLFDLTPAESHVARGIGEGSTIETLAQRLNVSREMIRSHVKSVLAKTGLRRQLELAALLRGLHLPS